MGDKVPERLARLEEDMKFLVAHAKETQQVWLAHADVHKKTEERITACAEKFDKRTSSLEHSRSRMYGVLRTLGYSSATIAAAMQCPPIVRLIKKLGSYL